MHLYNKLVRSLVNLIKLPDNPGTLLSLTTNMVCSSMPVTYSLMGFCMQNLLMPFVRDIITCWRFFLVLFKAAHCTKYALESATLLIQLQILPERIQKQIIWSRVVNPSGTVAGNIPCDLHMEHLNRTAKDALGQHSHLNPKSVSRVGKCIGLF